MIHFRIGDGMTACGMNHTERQLSNTDLLGQVTCSVCEQKMRQTERSELHWVGTPDGKTLCGRPVVEVDSVDFFSQVTCKECKRVWHEARGIVEEPQMKQPLLAITEDDADRLRQAADAYWSGRRTVSMDCREQRRWELVKELFVARLRNVCVPWSENLRADLEMAAKDSLIAADVMLAIMEKQ